MCITSINNYIYRYARHLTFIFLLYNLIQQQSFSLGYNLLVKKWNWSDIYKLVNNIFNDCFRAVAIEIKAINKCTDSDIVKLKRQVQTIALQVPHLYARYLEYRFILKALSIGHDYLMLWITINPSDLRCPLILELADIPLFNATNQTAFKKI